MGTVYLARELSTGRQIALKVLKADSESAAQRFLREGEVTAGLSDPRIVKVHGIGTLGGKPCLAYELVEGARTFEEACDAEPEAAIPLLIDAAKALGVAHAAGLTHRDVKSENLLVDAAGRVKVTDFGLVTGEELSRLTRSGAWVGTPNTMAPEQFGSRQGVGPTTDVWALGVLLYRVLTGVYPFAGADTMLKVASAISRGDFARPSRVTAVPPALEAVCLKALELKPEERYPEGASFAAALEVAAQDPGRTPSRIRPLLSLLAVVGVAALVAIGLGAQARAEARRDQAEQELLSRLEPTQVASLRFGDLAQSLESLGDDLDLSGGAAVYARGLAAVGGGREREAREALGELSALSSERARASTLEACCDARWSVSVKDLRRASRRLRLRSPDGFVDSHLLQGRALTLGGDPVEGLKALTRVPQALSDEPWRSLALRAATSAGARGSLQRGTVRTLVEALPAESESLLTLGDWAEVLREPSLQVLVRLLEGGQPPAEFRPRLRDFAQRALLVARMPFRPAFASPTADGAYWGQPILGLRIRTNLPVSAKVYEVLADWSVVAVALELDRTEELYAVVRDALGALAPVTHQEQVRQRQRLFEAYLHASPTPVELGKYAMVALGLRGDQGRLARETLAKLTRDAAEPQRSFWSLWLAYVEVLCGAYAYPVPSLAEREASRSKLLRSEEWARRTAGEAATLDLLRADLAVREVMLVHSDLLSILWLGLARSCVAVKEPYASLDFFTRLRTRNKPSSEPWELEYVSALLLAHESPKTPSAAKAGLAETFERELLGAFNLAAETELLPVLRAAWNGRSLLRKSSYKAVEEGYNRSLLLVVGVARIRVQAAWFALGDGREHLARRYLREAATDQREAELRNRITALAEAGAITQEEIGELDKALLPRAAPVRAD